MISRQQRLLKRRRRSRITCFCIAISVLALLSGYGLWRGQAGGRVLPAFQESESGGGRAMAQTAAEQAGANQAAAAQSQKDEAAQTGANQGQKDGAASAGDGKAASEAGPGEGGSQDGSQKQEQASEQIQDPSEDDSQNQGQDPEQSQGQSEDGSQSEDAWKNEFYHVPAGPPVEDSYFSDALFIGDSRVQGLLIYSGLTQGTFYAEKNMTVDNILTTPIVYQGGRKITVAQALEDNKFGKIYIKLGLNELGGSVRAIADRYGEVVDQIREKEPEALIYVQAIMPVTRSKSDSSQIHNNPRIRELNELLKKLTWEKGIYYLDTYEGLAGEDGCLPEEASGDGIHLNKAYCEKWLDYLKSHTVRTGGIRL